MQAPSSARTHSGRTRTGSARSAPIGLQLLHDQLRVLVFLRERCLEVGPGIRDRAARALQALLLVFQEVDQLLTVALFQADRERPLAFRGQNPDSAHAVDEVSYAANHHGDLDGTAVR